MMDYIVDFSESPILKIMGSWNAGEASHMGTFFLIYKYHPLVLTSPHPKTLPTNQILILLLLWSFFKL